MIIRGSAKYWILLLIGLSRICYHISFRCRGFLGGWAAFFRGHALTVSKVAPLPQASDSLDDSFRVVTLLCHAHVEMWLWAYISWQHFSRLRAPVLILDDGSLTDEDLALLRRFPEVTIVPKPEADRRAAEYYRDYPALYAFREETAGTKIMDIPVLVPPGKRVMLFDSDLLFFRRPIEIIEALHAPVLPGFYFGCERREQFIPELLDRFPQLPTSFNAGFLVYERDWLTSERLKTYCAIVKTLSRERHRHDDQNVYALLASEIGCCPLPETYATDMTLKPERLVMKHYHSWMKHFFIQEGLWYLLRNEAAPAFTST